jgi:hypothetical protein
MLAEVLLDVLALVKAGVELQKIVEQAHVMQAGGATDKEVRAYIKSLRDDALADLDKE